MTAPVGIIRNPRSRRNKGLPLGAPPTDLGAGALLREPRSLSELEAVCRDFAARDIALLAMDGGDGTVRDVLSVAERIFPVLPPLAFLASGKTNILSATTGSWGFGPAALERLTAAAATNFAGHERRRLRPLRVGFADRTLLGFVFGGAAFTRAVTLSDTGLADRLSLGPARIATAIGRGLNHLARGRERRAWLSGTPMLLARDGEPEGAPAPRFVFVATTLERFTLGLWPFWNADARPIAFLDVDAPPRRLSAALLPVLRGRPAAWMEAAGYRSGRAERLRIALDAPFVLDGELYQPGPDGRITIEAGALLDFVAP